MSKEKVEEIVSAVGAFSVYADGPDSVIIHPVKPKSLMKGLQQAAKASAALIRNGYKFLPVSGASRLRVKI